MYVCGFAQLTVRGVRRLILGRSGNIPEALFVVRVILQESAGICTLGGVW